MRTCHRISAVAAGYKCLFTNRKRIRKGAVVPFLAIALPVVLVLIAFAVNISYLELNRTEMVIASDAASRAAGREFMVSGDQALAKAKGRDAASRNLIGGKPLSLQDSDFSFGQSTRVTSENRYQFTPGGARPNAVEITARRTNGSLDGPLRLLLPNPFAANSVDSTSISRTNQIEVDVALVIDRSGSMAYASNEPAVFPPIPAAAPSGWLFNGPAPFPSRWRDAVNAVDVFLNELQQTPVQEYVSMSTYNDGTTLDQDLTLDYDAIRGSLEYYTSYFESGQTNIGGGIAQGRSSFVSANARPYAAKVLIVLTDGIDTVGSDPVGEASAASDEDQIMIFTITFALEADQATMQEVAQAGRGKHYHASDAADLSAVFRDIAKQLPVLISK